MAINRASLEEALADVPDDGRKAAFKLLETLEDCEGDLFSIADATVWVAGNMIRYAAERDVSRTAADLIGLYLGVAVYFIGLATDLSAESAVAPPRSRWLT